MNPFKTSISARLIMLSIAIVFLGGALAAKTGSTALVPAILLLAVGGCIVGLVLGVYDHPGPVLVVAVLLPIFGWPVALAILVVANQVPAYANVLAVCGIVAATMFASSFRPQSARRTASATPEKLATP